MLPNRPLLRERRGLGGGSGIRDEALRFYRLAAAQGDVEAQIELGRCYQYGAGVAQDVVEAVRYYRLAAEQGCFIAQHSLGLLHKLGEGVAIDMVEAVR